MWCYFVHIVCNHDFIICLHDVIIWQYNGFLILHSVNTHDTGSLSSRYGIIMKNTLYWYIMRYSIILWFDGDLNLLLLLWKPTILSFPIVQWGVNNCSTCCTFLSFRALKWICVWSDVSYSFTLLDRVFLNCLYCIFSRRFQICQIPSKFFIFN